MKVGELMTKDVVTATRETPFSEIVDLLLTHSISGLPVVDDEGDLIGIVTEADLVSKEAYGGRRRRALQFLADMAAGGENRWVMKSRGQVANDVMTREIVTAHPTDDIRAVARLMVEKQVKRLPVLEGDRLVGMISRRDVLQLFHRSDHELKVDIDGRLASPLWVPEDHAVAATVDNGVVHLTGTVRYPRDVSLVSAVIWQLQGVVDVVSTVHATEPDPSVGLG